LRDEFHKAFSYYPQNTRRLALNLTGLEDLLGLDVAVNLTGFENLLGFGRNLLGFVSNPARCIL